MIGLAFQRHSCGTVRPRGGRPDAGDKGGGAGGGGGEGEVVAPLWSR